MPASQKKSENPPTVGMVVAGFGSAAISPGIASLCAWKKTERPAVSRPTQSNKRNVVFRENFFAGLASILCRLERYFLFAETAAGIRQTRSDDGNRGDVIREYVYRACRDKARAGYRQGFQARGCIACAETGTIRIGDAEIR